MESINEIVFYIWVFFNLQRSRISMSFALNGIAFFSIYIFFICIITLYYILYLDLRLTIRV